MITFTQIMLGSLPFLAGAFGIGLGLALLYYMFARIVNESSLQARAKNSVNAVIETVMILGALLFINWAISYTVSGAAGLTEVREDAHLVLARAAMERFLAATENVYLSAFIYEGILSILFGLNVAYSFGGNVEGSGIALAIHPLQGLHMVLDYQTTLMNFILTILVGVLGRLYLIKLAPYVLAMFLPFGILFRGLHFSRTIGSALIALVLVIYYIYPLSVIFTDYLVFESYKVTVPPVPQLEASIPGGDWSDEQYQAATQDYINLAKNQEFRNLQVNEGGTQSASEFASTSYLWTKSGEKLGAMISKNKLSLGLTLLSIGTGVVDDWTKTAGAVGNAGGKFAITAKITNALSFFLLLFAFWPTKVIPGLFELIVVQFFYLGYVIVVFLVTLVLEILISITAYKQISTTLGGEPLLFGLTKVI
jgi:hypothetical protein